MLTSVALVSHVFIAQTTAVTMLLFCKLTIFMTRRGLYAEISGWHKTVARERSAGVAASAIGVGSDSSTRSTRLLLCGGVVSDMYVIVLTNCWNGFETINISLSLCLYLCHCLFVKY